MVLSYAKLCFWIYKQSKLSKLNEHQRKHQRNQPKQQLNQNQVMIGYVSFYNKE